MGFMLFMGLSLFLIAASVATTASQVPTVTPTAGMTIDRVGEDRAGPLSLGGAGGRGRH